MNVRTERPGNSCVPVSVERLDQDKHADENVDVDQRRTGRPVESEQSFGLFTQREEIDIDFRVSGLPQRRSRGILIEKHFKPTCSKITSTTLSVTIRKR